MPTKTDIANIALAKFREGRITNIESNTDSVAVVMNDQYDHAIELLLEEHRWNFAGKRVTLTQLSDDPPFGWDHQYALPNDCIRLKDVNGESVEASSKAFTLEGRSLLTNDDTVTITYVAKIIDTTFFSPSFVEALAFKLASITCGRLTGDTELAIMLDKQYNVAVAKAIHNDTKADGSREHNLMQRMMNSSPILGGASLSGTGYTRSISSTSGTVAAHKHELTDLLATGATAGQTIIWNDTDQIWEAGDAASGGDVSTDAIFDAAGDLVVGTGADTAAKLPIGAANEVLKSNGTTAEWGSVGGTGDVVGDASSTDNAITRFNGTGGKTIQNSGASIDDTGNLTANNFTGTSSGDNTGDQDLSTYQVKPSEGAFVNGDKTKLDGIAAGAEVNDPTTLVDADIGVSVQAHSSVLDATTASFTTADQDRLDDAVTNKLAVPSSTNNAITTWFGTSGKIVQDSAVTIDISGNIATSGTVDGRDVSVDGTKLDTVDTNADVTDETNVVAALDGATITTATVAGADKVLVQDADDTDNLKTVTAQSIANLGGGGSGMVTGVSKNSGANVNAANRSVLNFIEGSGVTLTVTDDAGGDEVDIAIAASGGDVATDSIFTTVGDLVVGTGSSTAARLGIGTNGQVLKVTGGTVGWGTGSGGSVSQLSDLSDVNTSTPTNRNALIADGVDFESRALVEADISDLGTYLASTDIDTLAELNAIVGDATLIDTADARLSDSRTPTSHGSTHLTAGGDAIQLATNAQEGLASAAHVTAIEANTAASHAAATKSGTGTYVSLTGQDIVVDPIDLADLSATGTASPTTYLRGDNTWATVAGGGAVACEIGIACGDETTVLTASAVAKVTFTMPYAMTLTEVMASVVTAPTTTTVVVDIHDGAATIMDTHKLDILTTALVDDNTAVVSDTALAKDAIITVYVDTADVAAAGLKIWLIGTRT